MQYIYNFFGGRSTTAFWIVLTLGSVGFFTGRMNGQQFVSLVIASHAFIAARAIGEDLCAKNAQPDKG